MNINKFTYNGEDYYVYPYTKIFKFVIVNDNKNYSITSVTDNNFTVSSTIISDTDLMYKSYNLDISDQANSFTVTPDAGSQLTLDNDKKLLLKLTKV